MLDGPVALNFMNFEAAGSAVTYDSNSFAPDSASTATSIATGYKTYSGSINVDETATVEYETIAEKVHEQLGWEVGVITSVNLNHATPAAFYAHQASRSDYYEIGEELIESGFEYFAGGGLLDPDNDGAARQPLRPRRGSRLHRQLRLRRPRGRHRRRQGRPHRSQPRPTATPLAYEIDRTDDVWALSDLC